MPAWAVAFFWVIGIFGAPAWAAPTLALYYGARPPVAELRTFDIVVLDPASSLEPAKLEPAQAFAYVSVGEVHPSRDYSARIPSAWLIGENKVWGSKVLDQTQPAWRQFFLDKVIAPLWQRGFRGFFFDTMDSYQLAARTPEARARQEAALVSLIKAVSARYPDARLILNRGFEILPQVKTEVFAVAAESLFGGWDQARQRYVEVPDADRAWLLAQLARARDELGLKVYAIDYAPPEKPAQAREIARRILALGIEPYVTRGDLAQVGLGRIEPVRRRVLLLHDEGVRADVALSSAVRLGAMPLHYLGYATEYQDIRDTPSAEQVAAYAGVVVWLTGNGQPGKNWLDWLDRQRESGVPVVFLGPDMQPLNGRSGWGVKTRAPDKGAGALRLAEKNPAAGFEIPPLQTLSGDSLVEVAGAQAWLRYRNDANQVHDAAALTPWGAYALLPRVLITLPAAGGREQGVRWVIDPIRFLAAALRQGGAPVPDVSTATGRRVLMVHIDGDGFPSRAEFPGSPYAGEVLLREIFQRYPLPTTMSVIQGEIAPDGLYPDQSAALEAIARRIYALPHVEAASHTYSHPFKWREAERGEVSGSYHLDIPGYRFDLEKEVAGSIRYINDTLLPPGKRAEILLWSGDTTPGAETVRYAERLGLLNMNHGYTVIDRNNPSLAAVEGLYLDKGGAIQVYAPMQNENVYTNLWQGPFYGYERVIETFELTGAPRRLKPVNIYYHTYSASKPASLKALRKVYDWALAQPLHPVFGSEYIRSVLDFVTLGLARTERGYLVRGARQLRTLRLPADAPAIDWRASKNLAGERTGPDGRYLHLAGDTAEIVFARQADDSPTLWEANGRVTQARREGGTLRLGLRGHVPLEWAIRHTQPCQFKANGAILKPVRQQAGISHFTIRAHDLPAFDVVCAP
ncbi:MAG: bifunctional glycoside hydrolase 114/ polysaccharide deacetylase family protein [Gammaproteobacteria bacterium]